MMKTITRYHFSCPYDFLKKGQKKKKKKPSSQEIWYGILVKVNPLKMSFNTIL